MASDVTKPIGTPFHRFKTCATRVDPVSGLLYGSTAKLDAPVLCLLSSIGDSRIISGKYASVARVDNSLPLHMPPTTFDQYPYRVADILISTAKLSGKISVYPDFPRLLRKGGVNLVDKIRRQWAHRFCCSEYDFFDRPTARKRKGRACSLTNLDDKLFSPPILFPLDLRPSTRLYKLPC